MQFIKTRLSYLFGSTKGLILVAIAMISMVTAMWGMLSGPMAEMGVRDWVIKTLGMDIVQAEREGRIIILYHSIAMGVIAIETYMVTGLLKMKAFYKTAVNMLITVVIDHYCRLVEAEVSVSVRAASQESVQQQ